MTRLEAAYRRRVEAGELCPDRAQACIVEALARVHTELVRQGPPPRGWRRTAARLARRLPPPVRGVYLWGGVGRGKTLLMDLFHASLPFEDKLRQHFHRFMGIVHGELQQLREQRGPLELTADRLAARTRVICFDEFAVTDIADAMILGNLFSALFERGVTLVATSNIAPRDLYRDGLQRQRFLPTIDLIERHTEVVRVDGEIDYRLRVLEQADVYQHPPGPEAERRLGEYFAAIAPDDPDSDGVLDVLGRPIAYHKAADGVIWFDFGAICDGPRSQNDYVELSRCYQTLLVSNIPRFGPADEDRARRFIALIDELYDRRVKLIASAAAQPGELYCGHRLRHDFERTTSRLREMQTHDYLASAHRA